MDKQNKHWFSDPRIIIPALLALLVITMEFSGIIWAASKAATHLEAAITTVDNKINYKTESINDKVKDNIEKINENSAVIKAINKTMNKTAVDVGKISVQVNNQQEQTREMKQLLQLLLIEAKK